MDMPALLERIGDVVYMDVRESFAAQAFDGNPWLPRGGRLGFNLAGMIVDFADGLLAPQASRFDTTAGKDTGAMFDGITVKPAVDVNKVEVAVEGPAAKYADLFDGGGIHEPISINAAMRKAARTWIKTDPRGKEVEKPLRAAMDKTSYAAESPARPFLGVSQEAEFKIADLILEAFEE